MILLQQEETQQGGPGRELPRGPGVCEAAMFVPARPSHLLLQPVVQTEALPGGAGGAALPGGVDQSNGLTEYCVQTGNLVRAHTHTHTHTESIQLETDDH